MWPNLPPSVTAWKPGKASERIRPHYRFLWESDYTLMSWGVGGKAVPSCPAPLFSTTLPPTPSLLTGTDGAHSKVHTAGRPELPLDFGHSHHTPDGWWISHYMRLHRHGLIYCRGSIFTMTLFCVCLQWGSWKKKISPISASSHQNFARSCKSSCFCFPPNPMFPLRLQRKRRPFPELSKKTNTHTHTQN